MFAAPALEWRIDPGERPALGARRDGKPIGALIVAIGTLWLAVPLPALLGDAPFPVAEFGHGVALASLGIGIALVIWGLRILVRRQVIRIEDDRVSVTIRGMTGTTSWIEPLAGYGGMVWRSEPIRRRGGTLVLHLVDLWHEDRSRTLTLLSSTSEVAARNAWQAWSQELGLAAIRWRAGEEGAFADASREAAAESAVLGRRLAGTSIPTRLSR